MKELIVKALKWALSKFEDKTPQLEAWPFPAVSEDFEPRPCEKKKPRVKKATTRPAKKKPAVVAKTARTKKAK